METNKTGSWYISRANHRSKLFAKILILMVCVISWDGAQAQQARKIVIQKLEASPGQKISGKLIVEEGIDEGTFIPVTIINGQNPGPVLSLIAGIHGTEYVPIIVLQKLISEINPKDLSGTVILAQVANIPSYLNRSVYTNPIDQKNLNRVFPGSEDGTISERIAFTISNEIISKSDYYIDLHGGEFNESLVNYLYFYYGCPDADVCGKSKIMAHAMGDMYLIPFDFLSVQDSLSQYSEYAAMRKGVPAIAVEFGDQGKVEFEVLEFATKGVINVMRTIGMLEGEALINEHPVYLTDERFIQSDYDGIFYQFVEKGQSISKGTLLGYTSDYWGNKVEEYISPYSGIVVMIKSSPSIKKGETISHLARISEVFESE